MKYARLRSISMANTWLSFRNRSNKPTAVGYLITSAKPEQWRKVSEHQSATTTRPRWYRSLNNAREMLKCKSWGRAESQLEVGEICCCGRLRTELIVHEMMAIYFSLSIIFITRYSFWDFAIFPHFHYVVFSMDGQFSLTHSNGILSGTFLQQIHLSSSSSSSSLLLVLLLVCGRATKKTFKYKYMKPNISVMTPRVRRIY